MTGARASATVCLISTGQPSTNPRLVKEADALTAAGHAVRVIGVRRSAWADTADRDLLATRSWRAEILTPGTGLARMASAARHLVARGAGLRHLGDAWLAAAVTPAAALLNRAAIGTPAALYIAHNLGALPAAAAAAATHGARLGFDAEDFHSGQFAEACLEQQVHRAVEERYLGECDYVTASSPGIGARYGKWCRTQPTVVLNVFPLAERPATPFAHEANRVFRLYWFSQTIGPDRGLEDAVAAVGELRRFPIELHLRGEWQNGYEERLRGLAKSAGVSPQQVVAHEPAASDQMARLAAPYDIGLALEPGHTPNNDLALSNKIFTYLLAGVPVLASATSAQSVLAGELGAAARTFRPRDHRALAAALESWLTDKASLEAARAEAWKLAGERFNWDREQQVFLNLVKRTLTSSQSCAAPTAELVS